VVLGVTCQLAAGVKVEGKSEVTDRVSSVPWHSVSVVPAARSSESSRRDVVQPLHLALAMQSLLRGSTFFYERWMSLRKYLDSVLVTSWCGCCNF
jgi:hypothetical protein